MTALFWKPGSAPAFGTFHHDLGFGLMHLADPAPLPGKKVWTYGHGRHRGWGEATTAGDLLASLALPARAVSDAAHIAVAAVHGMHFLPTWNCTHIANAEMAPGIREACRAQGFSAPVICTPEELMGT